MTLQEIANQLSMDYEGAVARFGGNEGLYSRFLNKFLQDSTYETLMQAVSSEDYDQIERQAHTLKGVAANLGLQQLSGSSDRLVQAVRQKDWKDIEPLFAVLQEEYQKTARALSQLAE